MSILSISQARCIITLTNTCMMDCQHIPTVEGRRKLSAGVARPASATNATPSPELQVKDLNPLLSRSKYLMALASSALAAGLFAAAFAAWGQEQSAATAQDVIRARKNLMNAIEENSDRIARM